MIKCIKWPSNNHDCVALVRFAKKLLMRTSLFLIVFTALFSAGCSDSSSAEGDQPHSIPTISAKKTTTIQWIDSTKNFGRINEGQKLALSFRFKNTGDNPLVIRSVQPSCGCTVADYPKEPIAPGAEGEITGEFDSKGREGLQHKELTVMSNSLYGIDKVSFEVIVVPQTKAATK